MGLFDISVDTVGIIMVCDIDFIVVFRCFESYSTINNIGNQTCACVPLEQLYAFFVNNGSIVEKFCKIYVNAKILVDISDIL